MSISLAMGIVAAMGLCVLIMIIGLGFLSSEWEKDDAALGPETDE